jgi:hypothetical protein
VAIPWLNLKIQAPNKFLQNAKIEDASKDISILSFAFLVVILIFEFLYCLGLGAWNLGFISLSAALFILEAGKLHGLQS